MPNLQYFIKATVKHFIHLGCSLITVDKLPVLQTLSVSVLKNGYREQSRVQQRLLVTPESVQRPAPWTPWILVKLVLLQRENKKKKYDLGYDCAPQAYSLSQIKIVIAHYSLSSIYLSIYLSIYPCVACVEGKFCWLQPSADLNLPTSWSMGRDPPF